MGLEDETGSAGSSTRLIDTVAFSVNVSEGEFLSGKSRVGMPCTRSSHRSTFPYSDEPSTGAIITDSLGSIKDFLLTDSISAHGKSGVSRTMFNVVCLKFLLAEIVYSLRLR